MQLKIISGGQTGVDRGALDAALEAGAACGGWCPRGRKSEDGVIDKRYPLTETTSTQYVVRTKQNILDSDGTLVIYFDELEGGTARTLEFCQELKKPCYLVNAKLLSLEQAAEKTKTFIQRNSISRLNVAGPRASKEPTAGEYAKQVILKVLA